MRNLSRILANREWNQNKREKCVAVNKAERSWRSEEHFDIRHGDAESGVCPVGFSLALVQYFLPLLPPPVWKGNVDPVPLYVGSM